MQSRIRLAFLSSVAALVLIAATSLSSHHQPAQVALSWDEYRALLEDTAEVATALRGAAEDEAFNKLSVLATKWEDVEAVTLLSGETILVDSSYLVTLLRSDPPNPARVADLLWPILSRLDVNQAQEADESVLRKLDSILAKPEFQWEEQGANPFQQAIQDFFLRILQFLGDSFGEVSIGFSFIRWIMITLGVLVIIGVVYFFGRGVLSDIVSETTLENPLSSDEEELTAEQAFSRATTLSKAGNLREAVRLLYLSTLLSIEESGRFHFDRSLTNVEYLRRLKGQPDLAEALREIVGIFDRVWYGFEAIDLTTFEQYAHQVAELRGKR